MRNLVIGWIVLFTMAGTAFSETKEPPKKLAAGLGGGVKMEMTLIPAGEFKMGSGESAEATADIPGNASIAISPTTPSTANYCCNWAR